MIKLPTDKYRLWKKNWFAKSGYEPHPKQAEVHEAQLSNRFIVIVAGRRWGKTLLASHEAEIPLLIEGSRGWIVSPTYDLAEKTFRKIHANLVIKQHLPCKAIANRIEMDWGAVVECKSAAHPEGLQGEGLDWIIYDECASCKQVIWEQYLRPTLTDTGGWAIFISTPKSYNYFFDLYNRGQSNEFPEWYSVRSPSWDNPYLAKKEIEGAKRESSDVIFRQEYGAEFSSNFGNVYPDFDASLNAHGMNKQTISPNWKHYRAFDFGWTNPMVCLWFAIDPSDIVYLYDEYYVINKTMTEHIPAIKQREREHAQWFGNMNFNGINAVPYAFSAADPEGKNERMELSNAGIYTIITHAKVEIRVEYCRQRLKFREDGTTSFKVDIDRCPNFIKEAQTYAYPETSDIRNEKEAPIKKDNHAMDAWGYFEAKLRVGVIEQSSARY